MKKHAATTLTTLDKLGEVMQVFPAADDGNTAAANNNGNNDHHGDTAEVEEVLDVPEPMTFVGNDAIDYEEKAKKIRDGRVATTAGVGRLLVELDRLEQLGEEAFCLAAARVAQLKTALQESLRQNFPPYRRAAWVAFLRHAFVTCGAITKDGVEKLLAKLVAEERLIPTTTEVNRLEAYGKTYKVNPASSFESSDVIEVKAALNDLLSRVYQEVGKARQARSRDLANQATMGIPDLLAGMSGRVYILVPPVKEITMGGQEFWRAGGGLLLESNGENVWPLGASGGIEGGIEEAIDLEVHLKIYTIAWKVPPIVRGLSPDKGKKVQLLWHLLNRTIKSMEAAEQAQANQRKLIARATCTAEAWLMEGAIGICALQFPIWEVKDHDGLVIQRVRDLLVLVERRDNGTIAVLTAESMDSLGDDFLASCMGEYEVVGEKFEGVPFPLRAILQAGYGQVIRKSQDDLKQVQIVRS